MDARSTSTAGPDRGFAVVPKREPAVSGDEGQPTAARPRFLVLEEFDATLVEPSPVSASMDLEGGPVCKWGLCPVLVTAGKGRVLEVVD